MDLASMKVFVPNPIHPEAMATLRERVAVVAWDDPALENWRDEADAVIVRGHRVGKDDIARCKRLKVIGKHGIGVDNIDVADARAAGVEVVYTPHENVESVAELAVAFMLALSRNLYNGNLALREGRQLAAPELVGMELAGKTLGIVGFGRIGQRVGAILHHAFGMAVAVFDPFLPEDAWGKAPFAVRRCDSIENLAAVADYITVHVPLTDRTRGLVGAAQLKRCKPGAVLVNTARGGIVDESALRDALASGKLRAAASDVFVREPVAKDHPLLALANFMAMPHVGANTADALHRMGMTVAADILAVLGGGKAKYYVP